MTINPAHFQKLMALKEQIAANSKPEPSDMGMMVEFDASKLFNQVAAYCYLAISEYLKENVLKEGYGYPEVSGGYCLAPHAYNKILEMVQTGQFKEEIFHVAEKVFKQIIEGVE